MVPKLFSRNAPPFVTGISRTLKIARNRNRNACSFFFAQRHKLPCLIHQVLRARTVADRRKAFGGLRYIPTGVMKTCRSVS